MVDINREGFTNQFEGDSRFAEGRHHAAFLPAAAKRSATVASFKLREAKGLSICRSAAWMNEKRMYSFLIVQLRHRMPACLQPSSVGSDATRRFTLRPNS
jgi:hypothetical protein